MTALATADTFLRANGRHYTGDPIALAEQLLAVLSGEGKLAAVEEAFVTWLEPRLR